MEILLKVHALTIQEFRATMIIAMESWHVKHLRKIFPNLRDKIYLLSLFENKNKIRMWSYQRNNIPDPFGNSEFHFYECFKRIERCIEEMLSLIQTA